MSVKVLMPLTGSQRSFRSLILFESKFFCYCTHLLCLFTTSHLDFCVVISYKLSLCIMHPLLPFVMSISLHSLKSFTEQAGKITEESQSALFKALRENSPTLPDR